MCCRFRPFNRPQCANCPSVNFPKKYGILIRNKTTLRASGVFRRGHGAMDPPLARPWKFFTGDFIWKGAFLPFSSKNCIIQQCLMVFFSYRYNMRLKSPCEIASDMTLWFSAFSKFRKKWANLRLPLNFQKQQVFQLQGGFAPDQGLCPWTPLGAPPPDPRYRLALCALAMPPPPLP